MQTMQKPIDNKAVYHTWILVVLWVFELLAEIIVIGVNAFYVTALGALLSLANQYNNAVANGTVSNGCYVDSNGNTFCDNTYANTSGVGALLAAVAVALSVAIAFLISHIVQIVFYGRKRLTPKANFVYDCTRFVIWTVILILNIAGAAVRGGYILSVIFAALVWILYLMSIIYSSILFHRQRRGDYDNLVPYNPHQSRSQNQPVQHQTVYPNKQEANYQNGPGPYQPPYQSGPGVVPNPPQFQHQ